MDARKRARLESAGWKVGDAADFLELTPAERELVEMRLALGRSLKAHRQKKRLTQSALAKRLGSSQSRIAKMEGGDASVSLDLLIQGLLALDATRKDVAKVLAGAA
jgi:DNA-binding XRE family transcriptional regulator